MSLIFCKNVVDTNIKSDFITVNKTMKRLQGKKLGCDLDIMNTFLNGIVGYNYSVRVRRLK